MNLMAVPQTAQSAVVLSGVSSVEYWTVNPLAVSGFTYSPWPVASNQFTPLLEFRGRMSPVSRSSLDWVYWLLASSLKVAFAAPFDALPCMNSRVFWELTHEYTRAAPLTP